MSEDWEDDNTIVVVKEDWQDEDDNIKDAWDEEEEPVKPIVKSQPAAPKAKQSSKTIQKTIPISEPINETEQERKARLERLVMERDLENAMELLGVSSDSGLKREQQEQSIIQVLSSPFDTMDPSTISEFEQFSKIILKRFESFEDGKNYPQFLETLITNLMMKRDVPEIRKVAGILSDMASTKLKEKQSAIAKKPAPSLKGAKKGGSKYDDYDSFMDGDGFDD